jgi:hypothetical protein
MLTEASPETVKKGLFTTLDTLHDYRGTPGYSGETSSPLVPRMRGTINTAKLNLRENNTLIPAYRLRSSGHRFRPNLIFMPHNETLDFSFALRRETPACLPACLPIAALYSKRNHRA